MLKIQSLTSSIKFCHRSHNSLFMSTLPLYLWSAQSAYNFSANCVMDSNYKLLDSEFLYVNSSGMEPWSHSEWRIFNYDACPLPPTSSDGALTLRLYPCENPVRAWEFTLRKKMHLHASSHWVLSIFPWVSQTPVDAQIKNQNDFNTNFRRRFIKVKPGKLWLGADGRIRKDRLGRGG